LSVFVAVFVGIKVMYCTVTLFHKVMRLTVILQFAGIWRTTTFQRFSTTPSWDL